MGVHGLEHLALVRDHDVELSGGIHSLYARASPASSAGCSTSTSTLSTRLSANSHRTYSHLARDGREHAIKLLDALNTPEI
jgi:hypothetical protein